jgi:hypothetical protein
VLNQVSTRRQQTAGDIVVPASFQLVHTLIEHELVDKVRLKIFPVALRADERLFRDTSDKKPMRLLGTQTLKSGIAYLTYQPVPGRLAGVRRRWRSEKLAGPARPGAARGGYTGQRAAMAGAGMWAGGDFWHE